MEARKVRAALLAVTLLVSMGASYKTPNFIMQTADPQLAEQFGKAAEQYRRDLAVAWLGAPMPDWAQPCTITVRVGANLGAGGATSFVFDQGEVFGWRMNIQGSAQRVLDSVLPHEITHMIFACHFRQPLPRWADEGGATSVEHVSERMKYRRMLNEFLRTGRGISFNQMFAMREYPRDVMPLYAQGYVLAEFLIQQGGRRKYLDFVADGIEDNRWSVAIERHYGIRDLGTLQRDWLAWVGRGCPTMDQPNGMAEPEMLASNPRRSRPEPDSVYQSGVAPSPVGELAANDRAAPRARSKSDGLALVASAAPAAQPLPVSGWHATGTRPAVSAVASSVASSTVAQALVVVPSDVVPVRTQVTHPQPIQKSRQIILEWGRR